MKIHRPSQQDPNQAHVCVCPGAINFTSLENSVNKNSIFCSLCTDLAIHFILMHNIYIFLNYEKYFMNCIIINLYKNNVLFTQNA